MPNTVLFGFHDMRHLLNQRVTQVDTAIITRAIDAAMAEHNRVMDAFRSLFVGRPPSYKLRYKRGGARRLQPLDEFGRALPVVTGAYYEVAYPIRSAGDAFGQTFKARVKQTVQEVNDAMADMLMADLRWNRDFMLAAIYTNTAYTFADETYGDLTVVGLANGDTATYDIMAGADAGAVDTHYLAQAAAIADLTNPYSVAKLELSEHPSNAGPYISFIPTNLKATTQALATFEEAGDPNIGNQNTILTAALGTAVPGTVIGYESAEGVWVVEWPILPNDYIITIAAGGDAPLGIREEPEPELQGFRRTADRDDHPYYLSQYERHAGYAGWSRIAATVTRIGNAAYAIPTGYDASAYS